MQRLAPDRSPPVHPRAGGEHDVGPLKLTPVRGSSPRRRGTPRPGRLQAREPRFIPAQAGNTFGHVAPTPKYTVHPRAGGEHAAARPHRIGITRFIPAQAGNTSYSSASMSGFPVHPRAGGEHFSVVAARASYSGSSPRGRGTRDSPLGADLRVRFIPARAGNTTRATCSTAMRTVHPRAGGEHNHGPGVCFSLGGSSPRGRGTPELLEHGHEVRRFIPARAGNTWCSRGPSSRCTVHPRAGGEHRAPTIPDGSTSGSSPRGRGTLRPAPLASGVGRFIPARAGNTGFSSPR